jgi:DNA polymerase III psi subunit
MDSQLTANEAALRLFFTDDIYIVNDSDHQIDAGVLKAEPQQEALAFKFLGGNKRNVLILVNDRENEVSDERGRELLRKIVKSVNLSAADFALVNYAAYPDVKFEQFQSYFSPALVFAFGVTAAQLALPEQVQNTIVLQGHVRLIFSAELKALDQDAATKKSLWGSLQKLGL